MPFVPTPGAARAGVVMKLDNQPMQCTIDIGVETETEANLQDGAQALYTAWMNFIMPQLSADLTLDSAVAFGLSSPTAPIGVWFPGTVVAGEVSAASLPNNVAYCVSKYTGSRGRSFRGRFFVPGIPENARETPSRVTSAYRSNILTACAGMLSNLITAGFPPVVVSWRTNGDWRTTGVATPITALGPVDDVLDSQRRRLPGRGTA